MSAQSDNEAPKQPTKTNHGSPVLKFEHVTRRRSGCLSFEDVSFQLNRGELLVIHLEEGCEDIGLADIALGLEQTDSGHVRYRNTEWFWPSSEADERRRAEIGRVFRGGGWIANLNVLENITLAQRYHAGRTLDELMPAITTWGKLAGLNDIPTDRPAAVSSAETLRCAQWVRAYYTEPPMVIMEQPMEDVPDRKLQPLVDIVAKAQTGGTAVLWLTSDPRVLWHRTVLSSSRFRMSGSRMIPDEEIRL